MAWSRRSLLAGLMVAAPALAFAGDKGVPDPAPEPAVDPVPELPPEPSGDILLDATQTVELEHEDRIFRLREATRRLGVYPAPDFSTTVVPASRMPENFHVDTPVLKVTFAEQVFFNTDSDILRPEASPILDAVAESLRGEAPDASVFVSGHTDNRGTEDHNYNLSIGRANSVAEALLDRGVGEVALWRVGFGEAVPLYPNDTPEHLGFNRRVEFLFASRTEPIIDFLSRQLDTVCIAGTQRQSDACRREVEVRERFTAVQLTRRPMGVGLTRASAPRPAAGRTAPARPALTSRPPASPPAVAAAPPAPTPTTSRTRRPAAASGTPSTRTPAANPAPSTPAPTTTSRTTSGRPARTPAATTPPSTPPAPRAAPRTSVNVDSVPVISQEVAINLRTRQATVNTPR